MTQICKAEPHLSDNDNRLIAEAMRRAMACRFNAGADTGSMEYAIKNAIHRGTKDMHGLMRAAAELARAHAVTP